MSEKESSTALRHIYRPIVDQIKLMQLATSRENRPWLCNVWYVMDDDDQIYWISRPSRRHSLEIADNIYVAATIHGPHNSGLLDDAGQALIISGHARQIPGPDTTKAYNLYAARFPKLRDFQSEEDIFRDQGHHVFYQLTPDEIIWWDEVNFPKQSRQVVLG
ncbi:MAG: pyridoxamine 5'-phosphate oxidase family protein [Pseudomonadota bacterium]